jgi:hypothetical protein
VDLGLKSLHDNFLPFLNARSMGEYKKKFTSLSDFLHVSARPSKKAEPTSAASSPLSKTWRLDGSGSSVQCHVSTTLHSLNGEDSVDWSQSSPRNGDRKLQKKLEFEGKEVLSQEESTMLPGSV